MAENKTIRKRYYLTREVEKERNQDIYLDWEKRKSYRTMEDLSKKWNIDIKTLYRIIKKQRDIREKIKDDILLN